MDVTFDPVKRTRTLEARGLDFLDAGLVIDGGNNFTFVDDRHDYGEIRRITAGYLHGRFVVIVWTQRGKTAHVISMRHGHGKEERRYRSNLGRSG